MRWNAKADSRRRATAGHEVTSTPTDFPYTSLSFTESTDLLPANQIINGMLHTDSKTNRFFRGLSISDEEWNAVRSVNKVLEVSIFD